MRVAADQIVAGLRQTPLLSLSEMSAALGADRAAHGIYAWWLTDPEALPSVPATPHPSEPVGLVYVGIAPGTATSKRSLYKRFGDHVREAGRSTLRYGLASFLFEQKGWKLRWRTDRPLLAKPYDDALTAWMETNLRVQWVRRHLLAVEIDALFARRRS